MCFSATGGFGVAAVIAGIGAVALTQDKPPSHRMAAVPLLFAAQQVAAGIVWMTIEHGAEGSLQAIAVALFLGFAVCGDPERAVVVSIGRDHRLVIKPA